MNILFVGKPGSGKGTITQSLINEGFLHLATGDLLRTEQNKGTELGKEIEALLSQGKFATNETVFFLVNQFLSENKGKSIIFDGFPRNKAQTEKCLDDGIIFDHVFLLEVSDAKIKERIVNRRIHQQSGRVYNIKTMPPKVEGIDDITGEPLIHRDDDKLEVIDNRLNNFNTLTEPLLEVLINKGYFIHKIDAEDALENQIEKIKNIIEKKEHKIKMK